MHERITEQGRCHHHIKTGRSMHEKITEHNRGIRFARTYKADATTISKQRDPCMRESQNTTGVYDLPVPTRQMLPPYQKRGILA